MAIHAALRLQCSLVAVAVLAGCGSTIHDKGRWPPSAWNRAEVVLFNHMQDTPGVPWTAYGRRGWSPYVAERRSVDRKLALRAAALVNRVQGNAIVSKCPFPRHAVVFFDGDDPVASANYCVGCGDLIIWPEYRLTPDEERARSTLMPTDDAETSLEAWVFQYSSADWTNLFREAGVPVEPWPKPSGRSR